MIVHDASVRIGHVDDPRTRLFSTGTIDQYRVVSETPPTLLAWQPRGVHGREQKAERIVRDNEHSVVSETGKDLPTVSDTITIRQRKTISLALIAKTVFASYPRRTILCFSLFVGQALVYNAWFFTYRTTVTTFRVVEL